jgi:three-Cys-motif partner protein
MVCSCKRGRCKDSAGNCATIGSDGLPVQCVGPWVEDKYFFLERYLTASGEARKKFAEKGNAVFLDLFSGPGRCTIENEDREIDGGGLRAFKGVTVPFNEYYYFDISKANVEALRRRLDSTICHVECGDSNELVHMLVPDLLQKSYRYHFAFVDPFGPDGLKFTTLRELAKLNRMDMLIHFPIGAIKRNLNTWVKGSSTILDDFLGTNSWRQKIKDLHTDKIFKTLVDVFTEQLKSIGYPDEGLKMASSEAGFYAGLPTVPIRNTKNVKLYVLILASKHALAQKIWTSIIKISPNGQKELF